MTTVGSPRTPNESFNYYRSAIHSDTLRGHSMQLHVVSEKDNRRFDKEQESSSQPSVGSRRIKSGKKNCNCSPLLPLKKKKKILFFPAALYHLSYIYSKSYTFTSFHKSKNPNTKAQNNLPLLVGIYGFASALMFSVVMFFLPSPPQKK